MPNKVMNINLHEKYNELIKIETLNKSSIEKNIESIGILIDISLDIKKQEGLNHAINLINQLKENDIDEENNALIHYFEANAWANIRFLATLNADDSWNWERFEFGHELINLRIASRIMKNYQNTDEKKYRDVKI